MLKYEFIAKGDKKVLLAKRCSKRNQCLGIQQAPIDIEMSFEYQPRPVEDLFAKDALTEKVRVQKGVTLKKSDIQAILGALSNQVVLVKTKYGQIAAFIGEKYKPGMKVKGKTVVEINQETKKYIKQNM